MIRLTIPGPPCAKQRPRVTKRGITYIPVKTLNYETLVRELFIVQHPAFEPMTGPIALRMWAFFAIPKGTSKRTRELMESGFIKRDKRPDYDNISKTVSDALNGLAFMDDGQIVSASIEKLYSERPRLEIELEKAE